MTLTADAKKRVVIPGAAPGDVFKFEKSGSAVILHRIYHQVSRKRPSKAQARAAIGRWKFKPAMSWEKLRALTREP
jgi:hypothetical protein